MYTGYIINGYIINKRRSSLSQEKVNTFVGLQDWMKKFVL